MREESHNWWLQALEDLETAEANIEIKRYYASVFFSQQAAEKALKAFYIEFMRDYPPKTHNMIEISRGLDMPDEVFEAVIELNPEYFVTRYPDAANGVPAQMYTEKKANLHFKRATQVIKWVKSQLKLQNL
jgi:HEPN domain-containing protein